MWWTYPKKGVKGSILHKLCDDHYRAALCYNALQMDDIGMVKLAHDRCLTQEVPSLAFSVACLQGLNGHQHLSFPRLPQVSATYLSKLTFKKKIGSVNKNCSPFIGEINSKIIIIIFILNMMRIHLAESIVLYHFS